MAEESMPRQLVDSVVKLIPDLCIEHNLEFDRFALEQTTPVITLPFKKKSKSRPEDRERERED